jgi:hypothetical protein
MPIIPDDAVSNILKPDKIGAKLGDRLSFVITAPHKANAGGTSGTLYSVPVKTAKGAGDFPLNKTHMSMFIPALGKDSDDWIGGKFEAFVVPQNNPQSKAQVLSWAVVKESIVPAAKKAK